MDMASLVHGVRAVNRPHQLIADQNLQFDSPRAACSSDNQMRPKAGSARAASGVNRLIQFALIASG